MTILIDLILLVIIALFVFIGYKQGLVKALIKILSFAIAIVVAVTLYKPVANIIINKTGLDEGIKNTIVEKITPEGISKEDADKTQINANELSITKGIIDVANNSIDQVADAITVKIIQIIAFIGVFIVAKLILQIVILIADVVSRLPVIKQFNKIRWYDIRIC